MSNITDFRDDAEVLRDDLRGLAQDILNEITSAEQSDTKHDVLYDIRALAAAQLVMLDRFEQDEAKAAAEAREWMRSMNAKLGLSDEDVDRLFPVETNGRLAPPTRRVFPQSAASIKAAA